MRAETSLIPGRQARAAAHGLSSLRSSTPRAESEPLRSAPSQGAGVVCFAGVARAAGIPNVHEFSEPAAFRDALPEILTAPGPTCIDLKVVPGGRHEYRWDVVHGPESRAVFREAIPALFGARRCP